MTEPQTIACPACGLEMPGEDLQAQTAHMKADHPEIIEARLLAAGFKQDADGNWIDTLASEAS